MLRKSNNRNQKLSPTPTFNTYLDLCNMVCRRLNEVEIVIEQWNTTRGVQSLIKDAVKAAIIRINQSEWEWPFNAAEHTEILVPGQNEYTWPVEFKIADFNSFQIQKDSNLNVNFKVLKVIERDEWYKFYRDRDYDAGSDGLGIPDFVFPSHGEGFGITRSPNKAYSLKYRYYLNPDHLILPTDRSRIPSQFDTVLINGALYHMYMFRDNAEAAATTLEVFEEGMKSMQRLLLNNYEYVRDTRVKF